MAWDVAIADYRCLEFFPTYIRVYQNAQMRLAIAQDLQIPALTSRGQVHPSLSWRPPCPAPWSCPGCWTSCHSWWCHECHWPGVTLSSSSSSLCCCYIIVTLHNDILVSYNTVAQGSAGCHRTHSELRLSRLLSPVAPDQLLTAGLWSAEPRPGREMGPSLRSWPGQCVSQCPDHTKRLSDNCHFLWIQAQEGNWTVGLY